MIRAWLAGLMMVLCVLAAAALSPDRLVADEGSFTLEAIIPERIGEWRLDNSVRPVLPRSEEDQTSLVARIYDQTLARTYRNPDGDHVMLVIAYGQDQSDALQLHLPEVCYASQGFAVLRKSRTRIELGGGAVVPAVRVVTRRGYRSEPVTYWTRIGDSVADSMFSRQWAKLAYGIRGRVPDGVLVRVSTITNRSAYAFELHERFLRQLVQAVDPARRRFLLGGRARPGARRDS